MCRRAALRALSVLVMITGLKAQSGPAQAATTEPDQRRAIRSIEDVMRAALALLPEQPAYVSLIDPDTQADPRVREAIRPFEAFTLPGKHGVYVNVHGATLQRALETRDERIYRCDLHVLAAMLWHEMSHVIGADETEAQAREERLWNQFVREGRVDANLGLRQMQIYASRRPR